MRSIVSVLPVGARIVPRSSPVVTETFAQIRYAEATTEHDLRKVAIAGGVMELIVFIFAWWQLGWVAHQQHESPRVAADNALRTKVETQEYVIIYACAPARAYTPISRA